MNASKKRENCEDTPRLFCLMGESLYAPLAEQLAPQVTVEALYDLRELAVIAKIRRSSEGQAPSYDITGIAQLYFGRIRRIQSKGPYLLGGFSAGGAVAMEVAQLLRRHGEEVRLVVLFDTLAVSGLRRRNDLEQLRLRLRLSSLWEDPRNYVLRKSSRVYEKLVEKLFKSPPKVSTKMTREEFHEFRKGFFRAALLKYRPKVFDGDVLVFRALGAERPVEYDCDVDDLGWRKTVRGRLRVRDVPGVHTDLLEAPVVQVVAEEIRACLRDHAPNDEPVSLSSELENAARSTGRQFWPMSSILNY